MARLFTALALPHPLRTSLALLATGIPGARWIDPEAMHLTLRFVGEVDGATERDVRLVLSGVDAPSFSLSLEGVGAFGDKKPHTLFAAVRRSEHLERLAAKIEQVLQRAGLPPETRRYTPHVTLARLKETPKGRVAEFLGYHGLFRSEAFSVSEFTLFSSHLGRHGASYRVEATYPLAASPLT